LRGEDEGRTHDASYILLLLLLLLSLACRSEITHLGGREVELWEYGTFVFFDDRPDPGVEFGESVSSFSTITTTVVVVVGKIALERSVTKGC
jgi:hypothetical protein